MPAPIKRYTDVIHIQSKFLMDSKEIFLTLAQRQAIELINRYSLQLATIAEQGVTANASIDDIRHELINYLTPIMGYSEMLFDGWIGELNPDQRSHIEIICQAIRDLRDVILKRRFVIEMPESA